MNLEVLFISSRFSNNGRETRQPYQPRQRPLATALAAAEQQDQAGEARVFIRTTPVEADRIEARR
jgi:hypothetical protein